jgi:DNA replication protein DnaC
MKTTGCKGFENYPCFNKIQNSEFCKALDEGRELKGWSCNGEEYYQLFVDSNSKVPLKVDNTTHECPKLVKQRKKIKPLEFQGEHLMTFDNFDETQFEKPGIIEEIKNFHLSIFKILLLLGDRGRGKTHLASALMHFLNSQRKKTVVKINAEYLSDIFFDLTCFTNRNGTISKLKSLYEHPFIYIDDLGSERHTDKEIFNQGFKRLLDKYVIDKGGRLIITSNLNLNKMLDI